MLLGILASLFEQAPSIAIGKSVAIDCDGNPVQILVGIGELNGSKHLRLKPARSVQTRKVISRDFCELYLPLVQLAEHESQNVTKRSLNGVWRPRDVRIPLTEKQDSHVAR